MAEEKTIGETSNPAGASPIGASNEDFAELLKKDDTRIPQVGDIVIGAVLSSSKAEVRLDIGGITIGVVRGRELYHEADEYANLKPGDEIEATVVEEENENGELELSFRRAGEEKAWSTLFDAYENKKIIKVKITDANKGGLLASYRQISGFLPVSQLAPENYPRVSGGDKGKILSKLKSYIGNEFEVKVMNLDRKEEKVIVSEKDAWQEKQKDVIIKHKIGNVVEGEITAITDFGVFVSFGENLEGLIHISELAWQRIDDPADLFKVGDKIKAEIISIDGSKIFLSAKKLLGDPWKDVDKKYKEGQIVTGIILKVNPFGLFVELDRDIHGLAHITQLGLASGQKISDGFKPGEKQKFTIVSIESKEHRLGLAMKKESAQGGQEKDVKKAEEKLGEENPPNPPRADKAEEKKTDEKKVEKPKKKTEEHEKKESAQGGGEKEAKKKKEVKSKKEGEKERSEDKKKEKSK
ncbi:S1 RNA-binding domain-containing protein [Patescibacteria group bacterium]|nr:S1 RNA-binding domain-containing protein [Patescibacteria group bacterium]MBU4455682.1 S1 RNA-binding domain-containing protein [Patescibacteria group bacterium]